MGVARARIPRRSASNARKPRRNIGKRISRSCWISRRCELLRTRRQSACQGKPPLRRVVHQLQVSPIELLKPPPPFDGLELFFLRGELVAAEADAVRLPRQARG